MLTLKELREKKYLSIPELEKLSGVPRMTIYNIEAGKHKPIKRTIRKLAVALEVEPQDIEL